MLATPPFRRAVAEPLGAFFKPPLEVGVSDLALKQERLRMWWRC